MSNEVKLTVNLRYDKNDRVREVNTSKWIDVSGDDYTRETQSIGTAQEALGFSADIASKGILYVKNEDSSNYVLIGANCETLQYDKMHSNDFVAGNKVTGSTSGIVGYVVYNEGAGASAGTLLLSNVSGVFTDNEQLIGETNGTASVNGTGAAAKPAYFHKLKAGEFFVGRITPKDAIQARADTAACRIDKFLIED